MFLVFRKSLVLAGGVLLTLGLIGSRAKAELIPLPDYRDLVYTIETDKPIYSLTEDVHVTHRVTNPLNVNVTLGFTQEPGFNLWIRDEGNLIWRSSEGFLLVVWELTLSPGETIQHDYLWNLTDANDNPVGPGQYELVSMMNEWYEDSGTTITIIPEPTTLVLLLVGLGLTSMRKRR